MLPPKYCAVLLPVFALSGCTPRPVPPEEKPTATPARRPIYTPSERDRMALKAELAGARITRARAIRIARKAFAKAGMKIGPEEVPDARYVRVAAYRNTPVHFEWWVYFLPKTPPEGHIGVGATGVYIDDRTGKARIGLGA